MSKKQISGLLRIAGINLGIIGLSALIGVSLNRSFLSGPQQAVYQYSESGPTPAFTPVAEPAPSAIPHWETASLSEVRRVSQSGEMVLLDGRSQQLYESGHIPGAFSLAVHDFEQVFPRFAARFPRDTPLVIYCGGSDCSLSRQLAELLHSKGYQKLKVYWGGYNDWFLNGNPVEKGKGRDFRR